MSVRPGRPKNVFVYIEGLIWTVCVGPTHRLSIKDFSQKTLTISPQIFNKNMGPQTVRPKDTDRESQLQITTFLKDFQQAFFWLSNCHSSKCNTCKFWPKWHYRNVNPMKLIPLDSTTIYHINPVIIHPLITLWPVKWKPLILYLFLELSSIWNNHTNTMAIHEAQFNSGPNLYSRS
jgi:hypothetical protein